MEFTVNDIKDSNPIGSIIQFAGANAPVGWLICDGSAISRTVYSLLFSVIGTTYGVGDGSTTFNLPNLQNRVPLGVSSSRALGNIGGEETHKLTVNEMPSHVHVVRGVVKSDAGSGTDDKWGARIVSASDITIVSESSGGNYSHNNMQPYIALNYIIKATYSYAVVDGYNNIYVSENDINPTSFINAGLTFTNCTLLYGGYIKIGKLVFIEMRLQFTSAVTNPILASGFPVPLGSSSYNANILLCNNGADAKQGVIYGNTTMSIYGTWSSGDTTRISGFYICE